MTNAAVGGMMFSLLFGFIAFLVMAFIARWIFRINAIHTRLEEIGVLLAELIKAVREK